MANFYYTIFKVIGKIIEITFTFTFPVFLFVIGLFLCIILGKVFGFFVKTDDKEKTEAEQCSKITNAVKNMSDIQAKYKNNVFEESTKEENNVFEK